MGAMIETAARPWRVLLVEDERSLASMLSRHLSRAGMLVHETGTEREALRLAAATSPDVVLLDLTLAEGNGAEVCRRLRSLSATAEVPIIVITARGALETKQELYALGADDYVVKPFEPAELLLRIDALLRRREQPRSVRRIGPLTVSLPSGDAWLSGTRIDVTAGERTILVELARNWPSLAPREALLRAPWREDERTSANVIEVLVGRLRKKLVAAGGGVAIRAVRRAGYVMEVTRRSREEGR